MCATPFPRGSARWDIASRNRPSKVPIWSGSWWIPFALPQITIFEKLDQLAHVRLYVDCYDNRTGRLIPSSPLWAGSAYYNQYTILFFIGFARTDLLYAP
jgi:hypothetical protein